MYAEDTLRARGIIRPQVKLTPSINFNELRRQKQAEKMKKQNSEIKDDKPILKDIENN